MKAALPLVLLAVIPVGLFMPALYPWLNPDTARDLHNLFYLNVPFLTGRTVAYVVVWLGLAVGILLDLGVRRWAPAGLILLALTSTFAAIDATLALDPHMNSSIYGMLVGTGMTLFALSLALLLALPGATGRGRDDLGKLLLALCVLWAYLDFVQFLVIWSSNLATDTPWMERRFTGFWFWALWAMAGLHTVAPLFLLAIPRFRLNDAGVMALAAALVLSSIVRGWWLVLPEAGRIPGLIDAACMIGVGATAIGAALLLGRVPALRRRVAYG